MAKEVLELDVKTNIKGVTKDVDDLGKSLKSTNKQAEQLEPAAEGGASGFKKVGLAVRAVGAAMKAIGIGLIISAFVALKEAFMRNQEAADFLKTSMTTISITFNEVVNVIVNMVKWVNKNSKQFEPYVKVMKGLIAFGLEPLKLAFNTTELAIRAFIDGFMRLRRRLGEKGLNKSINENMAVIEDLQDKIETSTENLANAAVDIYENFGDGVDIMNKFFGELNHQLGKIDIEKNYELADSITAAGNAAAFADIKNQKLNATYKKNAEDQRIIRDDIRNTLAVRIEANEELGRVLKKQQQLQAKEIQDRIDAAQLLVDADKKNIEAKLALGQEEVAMLQLKEEIRGQEAEQISNQAALEQELADAQKALALDRKTDLERELLELKQTYDAKLEMARKAGEDNTEILKRQKEEEAAIRETYADRDKADTAKTEQFKQQAIASSFSALGAITAKSDKLSKAVAVARTVYNTQQAIMNAMANIPAPWNVVQAAASGLMGAAAIRNILSTSKDNAVGGNVSVPPVTGAPPAPEMMSGSFTLGGSEEVEPARAYVVSDDITNNQNKLAIIRRRATI